MPDLFPEDQRFPAWKIAFLQYVVAATFLVDSESRLKSPAALIAPDKPVSTARRAPETNCGKQTDQGGACKGDAQPQTASLVAKPGSGR